MKKKRTALLIMEFVLLCIFAPSPALRFEKRLVTPYGFSVAAAAMMGMLVFEKGRLLQVKRRFPADGPVGVIFRVDAKELALCCIPAALLGARALYVLMRMGYYLFDAGTLHALCFWEGGFLLWGAVFGAMAAAAWLAGKRKADALGLLDDMAAPGLAVIAACRMAEFFAEEGMGPWIENPAFARLPFAVQNAYGEWQMAVFLWEALAALLMIAAVRRIGTGRGERIAAALVLYACTQVVFESLRMDGCLRIGFVRVSQVVSAAATLAVTGIRAYHAAGRGKMMKRCAVSIFCAALIGGMEWALDKTQVHNATIYGAMALVCAFMAANALYKGKDIDL